MKPLKFLLVFTLLWSATHATAASAKSKILIVTGQNNHDWVHSTPIIKALLEETNLFDVTVTTTPSKEAPDDAWNDGSPKFKGFDAILSDYNGKMWPTQIKSDFVDYVKGGGGVVLVHAANNAFTGWKEYEDMTGLLWREADHDERLYLDDKLKPVRAPKGEGPSAGHGAGHEYKITVTEPSHPVFKGVPKVWMHVSDELYHGQRGPAENMHILAAAFSSKESGGTGVYEPMVWWIPYGKGKVITLLPGHYGSEQSDSTPYDCLGFRTILQRSTEWVATGKVTIPVSPDFPTADKISVVAP